MTFPFRLLRVFLAGILLVASLSKGLRADPLTARDNYQTLQIPLTEFGFRGLGKDGQGQIYLTSLLKNGVYLLPPSCVSQECATFLRMGVPLSDPGQIVGLPGGGAFVLLRLADRLVYIPSGCYSTVCLKTIVLPRSPSYPSSGAVDPGTHDVWITEQLADQISKIPAGCYRRDCMISIDMPTKGSAPSGIAWEQGKGFWVTEKNIDRLAFIPQGCSETKCIREFSIPFRSDTRLRPFSPVILGEGKVAFLVKRGKMVSIMKTGKKGLSFAFMPMEKGIGRADSIMADSGGRLILLAKGTRLHVGKIRLSEDCIQDSVTHLSDCVDMRILGIDGGRPSGLMKGRRGEYWMALRNSDQIVRFRLASPRCLGRGSRLPKACYSTIAFTRKETLYHKEYHQEVSH